jgi:hypothetical protein
MDMYRAGIKSAFVLMSDKELLDMFDRVWREPIVYMDDPPFKGWKTGKDEDRYVTKVPPQQLDMSEERVLPTGLDDTACPPSVDGMLVSLTYSSEWARGVVEKYGTDKARIGPVRLAMLYEDVYVR